MNELTPFAPHAPKSWERVRLDRMFMLRREEPQESDELVSAFIDGQVTARSNRPDAVIKGSGMEVGYKRIVKGDLAISGMNAHLGGLGISDSDGRCSPVYLVLKPLVDLDAKFCSFLLRHMALSGYIGSLVQTIRFNSSDFKRDDIKKLTLTMPPLSTQRAIADYLDTETARIDALIAKKQRMIELLEERLSAARTRFVTCGIRDSEVISTGDDFFPTIPAHWTLRTLDALMCVGRPIVYGIVQPGPDIEDGVLYVKTGDLADLDQTRMSRTSRSIAASYSRASLLEGDIVLAMRASIGTLAAVPAWLAGGNLTQGTARISPSTEISGAWLLHALRSHQMRERMIMSAVGTTYLTLNIADIRKLRLPVPPLDEQNAIASQLNGLEEAADRATHGLAAQIELLREQRQALITAAVTGELEVPGVAA